MKAMTDASLMAVAGMGLIHTLGGLEMLSSPPPLPSGATVPDTSRLATLLPGMSLRRVPGYARMALLAALDALDEAGWRRSEQLRHTGLVLGSAFSCVRMGMDFMDSILDNGPGLASPTAFSHSVNNVGAGLVSLLLGLRGPCFTCCQFELSFAGALSMASALLGSGRLEAVLALAVDEVDGRFTACRPPSRRTSLPETAGAVALCLTRPSPDLPCLRVRWEATPTHGIPLFVSGDAAEEGVDHEPLYGHSPLTQALDTLRALRMVREGEAAVDCLCRTAHGGLQALVEVRRN